MKTKFLFTFTVLIFSFASARAADVMDEQQFKKLMKEVGRVAKGFKDNAQAKNAAAVEKDSARVAEIYTQMAGFWKARNADDAVKWSTASAASAKATAAAAQAGDWDKVKTHWGAVGKNCKDCHEAHREKVGNNYHIK